MKKQHILIILLLALAFFLAGCNNHHNDGPGFSLFGGVVAVVEAGQAIDSAGRGLGAIGDPMVEVCGVVLGYDGNPISGASVRGNYRNGDYVWFSCKTDEKGEFSYEMKASVVNVVEIRKEGYASYAPIRGGRQVWSKDIKYDKERKVRSNHSAPLYFKLRKYGPIKYVVLESVGLDPNKKGEQNIKLLRQGWYDEYGFIHKIDKPGHSCFKVLSEFNKEQNKYDIQIKSTGENSGVVIDDNFLHIAPETGYLPQVKFSVRKIYENGKYSKENEEKFNNERPTIYVKCGECDIYCRIDLSTWGGKYGLGTITCPEGQRFLDYDTERSRLRTNCRSQLSKRYRTVRWKALQRYKSSHAGEGVDAFDESALKEGFIRTIQKERQSKQD